MTPTAYNKPLVVIDTNCLIQMLGRYSTYHSLWLSFLQEEFILCISNEILSEYEEILTQKVSPRVANLFLQVIARAANVIRKDPYFKFHLIEQDPDDNKFVDCAIVNGASYIVSEDAHFRILKNIPFPVVRVIHLEQFAQELNKQRN